MPSDPHRTMINCIYGCVDPNSCSFPHYGCDHCKEARRDMYKIGDTVQRKNVNGWALKAHFVQSLIQGAAITTCGRRMRRWTKDGELRPLTDEQRIAVKNAEEECEQCF